MEILRESIFDTFISPPKGHESEVRSVALSSDGRLLASGSADKRTLLWTRDTLSGEWVVSEGEGGGHTGAVVALEFGGKRLVSGSYDRTVRVWEAGGAAGAERKLAGHTHWVMGVCWVGESVVASASYDRTARMWSVSTGECLRVMREHTDRVTSIAFSSVTGLLSTSSFQVLAKLVSVSQPSPPRLPSLPRLPPCPPPCLPFLGSIL